MREGLTDIEYLAFLRIRSIEAGGSLFQEVDITMRY